METRNIFIDASIFIGQNYDYTGAVFENITRLAKAGQANLFVTDISLREVKAHIEEDVKKAVQASSKFKKDARILRNIDESPFKEMFSEVEEARAAEALLRQLDNFNDDAGVAILSTDDVAIAAVFEKYFRKSPPFGDGKKKEEFPDAFTLEALEAWCGRNDEKMYVASTDADLKEYCKTSDRLIYISKLAEFIDVVELHDEVLSPHVLSLVEANEGAIKETISEAFCDGGFFLEDQDGEVNEVTVIDMDIQNVLLLEVGRDFAVLEVEVETEFAADISYDDLDTATYDSEDKVLIPWHTIRQTVTQTIEYTAIVNIAHDTGMSNFFNIESVKIETGRQFGFSVRSDPDWPY